MWAQYTHFEKSVHQDQILQQLPSLITKDFDNFSNLEDVYSLLKFSVLLAEKKYS